MRVLIAARKSNKVDNGEGMSLDTQDVGARKFSERLGFEVVGASRDTISGRVAPIDREDLGAWLATPWKFDAIVAYRTDRLSRGTQEDWTRIEHWATENGKTLIMADSSTGVRYPARDDSDYWQWQAFKRNAEKEWDAIQERNLRSQRGLMDKGAFLGKPPYGYRVAGVRYAKTLEIIPEKAETVREVFRRITEGESLRAVARWLESLTGRAWNPVVVRDMIMCWTYTGRVERKTGETDADGKPVYEQYMTCPAIVTADELVAAQKALTSRKTKDTGGRPTKNPALMVVKCGECGAKMYRNLGMYQHDAGKGHGFNVPVAGADKAVKKKLFASTELEMAEIVVPGRKVSGRREELKRDRAAALAREDIEKVVVLSEELKQLPEEDEPDRVEYAPTGRTVGKAYEAMSDAELRKVLRSWEIVAYPDGRLTLRSPWREAK